MKKTLRDEYGAVSAPTCRPGPSSVPPGPDRRPSRTGSSSSAPATSAAPPWPRSSPGRWPTSTDARRRHHAGRPPRRAQCRDGPWHEGEPMHPLASDALVRAGYPGPPPRRPPVRRPPELARIDLVVGPRPPPPADPARPGRRPGPPRPPPILRPGRRAPPPTSPTPTTATTRVFDECRDMIAAALRRPRRLPGRPLGHPLGGLAGVGPPIAPAARIRWSAARPPRGRSRVCAIVPTWSHEGSCAGAANSPCGGARSSCSS